MTAEEIQVVFCRTGATVWFQTDGKVSVETKNIGPPRKKGARYIFISDAPSLIAAAAMVKEQLKKFSVIERMALIGKLTVAKGKGKMRGVVERLALPYQENE